MNWSNILGVLKSLAKTLGLFFIYNKGKERAELSQLKKILKEQEENEKNNLANARKSNVVILDELHKRDSRKER